MQARAGPKIRRWLLTLSFGAACGVLACDAGERTTGCVEMVLR